MNWKNEKSLTSEQMEVLKAVNFPLNVPMHKRVQKRIKKISVRGGFVDKPNPELEDIKYLTIAKNVYDYFSKFQKTEDAIRAEPFTATYLHPSQMEAEMNAILNKFAPSLTPSMQKALEKTKEVEEVEEKEDDGLTDEQKAEAKQLAEAGKDLKEIAKALGVAQKLVKPYLLTLNN